METWGAVTKETLRPLLAEGHGPCVSLYMPTQRGGVESHQNPVLLKNLLRVAEQCLLARGLGDEQTKEMLKPAVEMSNHGSIWEHPRDGLAIFFSRSRLVQYPLPIPVRETVVVGDSYFIKPLLLLLSVDGCYFVLAISQNAVRLLRCTRVAAEQIHLEGVPSSLADALRSEPSERQVQHHSGVPGGAAMFYGHTPDHEQEKDDLLRYCQQIDRGLRPYLCKEEAPLVLAGVEYLLRIYRGASRFPHIVAESIRESPDRLSDAGLHHRAWPLVLPLFQTAQQQKVAEYSRRTGTGLASSLTEEIVRAAGDGRVSALIVTDRLDQPGRYDASSHIATKHAEREAGDEDLVNLAAIQTLLHGGDVYVVAPEEMPANTSLAAIFRY